MLFIPTNKYEITNPINNLNVNKASDISGLSANLVKILSHEIAPVLCCIFSEIFSTGLFPVQMKLAMVSSIYDGGSGLEVSNYRSLSFLLTLLS